MRSLQPNGAQHNTRPGNRGFYLASTERLRHLLASYERIQANPDTPPELKRYAVDVTAEIDAELTHRFGKAVA